MKKQFLLLVCATLFLTSSLVHAAPSLRGPTGLIEMPSAKPLEYKKFEFAFDYEWGKVEKDDETKAIKSETEAHFYKLNLGTFKNAEIGFVGGTKPDEGVFVNMKYFMMSDDAVYPTSLAIGMQNLGSKNDTDIYMVASKLFRGGLEGHIGFRALFRNELDVTAMLGIEYMINDQFSILSDVVGENQNYAVNAGVKYLVTPDIGLRVYLLDPGQVRHEETIITAGVSIGRFL